MNTIKLVSESKEWKDRMAGWCKWRIFILVCQACGKRNTSYTVHGTRQDAEKLASNKKYDVCDKCS